MRRAVLMVAAVVAIGSAQINTRDVMRRVGEYADQYEAALSALVADERYVQKIVGNRDDVVRTLDSEFLFVRPPEGNAWLGFRDVLKVDGRSVTDREDRLRKLLYDWDGAAWAQAQAIARASAQYNLGSFLRTVNVPIHVLGWLRSSFHEHFKFSGDGTEIMDGVRTVKIAFRETGDRTLIRTPENRDVRSAGVIWVRPEDGTVLQTELNVKAGQLKTIIRARFARDAALDMMVPIRMEERYDDGQRVIEGRAEYSRFRRFEVTSRIK